MIKKAVKFISDSEAIVFQGSKALYPDSNYYSPIRLVKINFDTDEFVELLNSDKAAPSASWTYLR